MKIGDSITHKLSGATGVIRAINRKTLVVAVDGRNQRWLLGHVSGAEPLPGNKASREAARNDVKRAEVPRFTVTEAPESGGEMQHRRPPT